MKKDKYQDMNDLACLGFLVNAMGGGGEFGQTFPRSDAEDLSRGLRFIPSSVTQARRQGLKVVFVQSCENPCCWYWQFPNGSRDHYWEKDSYERTARRNGIEPDGTTASGDKKFTNGVGACPDCGNTHMSGGFVSADRNNKKKKTWEDEK